MNILTVSARQWDAPENEWRSPSRTQETDKRKCVDLGLFLILLLCNFKSTLQMIVYSSPFTYRTLYTLGLGWGLGRLILALLSQTQAISLGHFWFSVVLCASFDVKSVWDLGCFVWYWSSCEVIGYQRVEEPQTSSNWRFHSQDKAMWCSKGRMGYHQSLFDAADCYFPPSYVERTHFIFMWLELTVSHF